MPPLTRSRGEFTWTPGEDQDGEWTVTVKVTDAGTPALSDSQDFTVTVAEVNASPSVTSLALANDTGLSATDLITGDPTITGTVADDGLLSLLSVEVDFNNDLVIDDILPVDSQGSFTLTREDLSAGSIDLQVRAREWDTSLDPDAYCYGDWVVVDV